MEVVRVVTGNWFPRTKLHLQEYYAFLTKGTSNLALPKEALASSLKQLAPKHVAYVGLGLEGRFDHVDAEFGKVSCSYFEDGLMLASVEVKHLDDDLFSLHSVYSDAILGCLTLLYSTGMPAISVQDPNYTKRPTIFLARTGTPEDADTLAAGFNDKIDFHASYGRCHVYSAKTLVVIVTRDVDSEFTKHLIQSIVFFREFESRLDTILNLHREVWDSIETIRSKPQLMLNDLPDIRDRLLDYDRDLSIVVARLAQMPHFLDERKLEVDELKFTTAFRALEAYRYGKMKVSTHYLIEMWRQLHPYIESTSEIVGLMYQEQFQKGMNIQQFIFLLGSVAGVLYLGGMSGVGFHINDLWVFGAISIVLSLVCYYGIKLFTTTLTRINSSHFLGDRRPFGKTRTTEQKNPPLNTK